MRRVSVHRSLPGELEGRQTGRMRELEEGWNGCDSPWRLLLSNLNRLRSQSICYLEAVIMPGCCQHCSAVGRYFVRGGRLLSYSQITPRPLAERRSLNLPSARAFG